MYVKRVQLRNYGPIARFDIECPFVENKPKPVILVGGNGSGKSIVLSHIVNGLLSARRTSLSETSEVEEGKVYKLRSASYIQSGEVYSFSKIDFEDSLCVRELQIPTTKQQLQTSWHSQNYQHILDGIAEIGAQDLWKEMSPAANSEISGNFNDKRDLIERIFSTRCILYFPPNRFEEPAWLNRENLKAKARYTGLMRLKGDADRRIINYSPLYDIQNWLLDVIYDFSVIRLQTYKVNAPLLQSLSAPLCVFVGAWESSTNLYDIVRKIVKVIMPRFGRARLAVGRRMYRILSIMENSEVCIPNIFQLSSGETSLLSLFLSILRDWDLCDKPFTSSEDIQGLVVVDEIDLHLHAKHQYEILPKLMGMFPRVQFIITSHSPLFVLGMQKIFRDGGFALYHLPRGEQIGPEEFKEFDEAYQAFSETRRHAEVVAAEVKSLQQPVVYVEGKTDMEYLAKAAELLGLQKILEDVQLRDGGGSGKLQKSWKALEYIDVEHQMVVLLHDCDYDGCSADGANVFRRIISRIESHPILKGIENRFSRETLEKARRHKPAFINTVGIHPVTLDGKAQTIPEQWTVNEKEKVNLCNWLCENGTVEDFQHFKEIFDELNRIFSSRAIA